MKQIVGILFLIILRSYTSGQSRVLVGTITSKLKESTTILPTIVTIKNTDGQLNDSAIYNPKYVAPPKVELKSNASENKIAASDNEKILKCVFIKFIF